MKSQYQKYKTFLDLNIDKYLIADMITTEGIPDIGLDAHLMDKIYAKAAMFYMEYELVKALVEEMRPLYEE